MFEILEAVRVLLAAVSAGNSRDTSQAHRQNPAVRQFEVLDGREHLQYSLAVSIAVP